MTRLLSWHPVDREALATYLGSIEILASDAVGDTTVYRCRGIDGESIAVALPGGTALIIATESVRSEFLERRRCSNARLDE